MKSRAEFLCEDAFPCNTCRSITLDALLSENGYKHHTCASALRLEARKGCRLCGMIAEAIMKVTLRGLIFRSGASSDDETLWAKVRQDPFLGLPVDFSVTLERVPPGHHQHAGLLNSDLLFLTPRTLSDETMFHNIRPTLGFYTDAEDLAATRIPGRRLPACPDSESSFQLFEQWINDSFEDSKDMNERGKSLPKRVLDVMNSEELGKICLKEIESPITARYIALSHCWGKSLPIKTTTENLSNHTQGIAIDNLTQTFRDAVRLTRRFGIRYLWIDSLCIVQDSTTDWQEESAKMSDYYKSSWLTIASGMAVDGLKGCFAARRGPASPYCRLNAYLGVEQPSCALYFTLDPIEPPIRGQKKAVQLVESPLHTRGWTFQEEVLAPRYLSFEPTQVYFRCDKFTSFETGRRLDRHHYFAPESMSPLERHKWGEVVVHYSSRDLTFESDKLPAISGLAHEYHRMWKSTYFAGLWKESLSFDLMWQLDTSERSHRKPISYRAPSWSWASVDGLVYYDGLLAGQNPLRSSFIDLLDASILLAGSDPMGQVTSGVLTLRAHVVYLSLEHGQDWDERLCGRNSNDGFPVRQNIHLDFENLNTLRSIWLLYVMDREGIVLMKTPGEEDIYERLGIFRTIGPADANLYWKQNGHNRQEIRIA